MMTLPVGYLGVGLVVQHLWDVAAVALLLTVATGVGALLVGEGDDALAVLEELVVGLGALALAMLALGAAGMLRPVAIAVVLVSAAVVAHRPLFRLRGRLRRLARGATPTGALGRFALALGVAAAAFVLVMSVAPPVDWDGLMYHLDVPAEWLAAGRIMLPPDNLHAAYAGVVHLLYTPLLAFASPAAPAVFGAASAILLGLAVAAGTARLTDRATGAWAAALLAGTGMLLLGAITPRVDVPLALVLTLAHLSLVRAALEPGGTERRLVRAALLLGIAGGIKYHGLAWAVALAPVIGWVLVRGVAPGRRWPLAGWMAAAFAAPLAPWLVKNMLLLGAPLYPFGSGPMLDPWLVEALGTTAVDPGVFGALREVRHAFTPWDAFFAPERISVEWEARYYGLSPALLLLPLWIVRRRDPAIALLAIPALLYGAVALVPSSATNLRYFLPMVPPLTMAVAVLARRLTARAWLPLILLVVGLVPGVRVMAAWTLGTPAVPLSLGLVSEELYIDLHHDPGVRTLGPAIRLVRSGMPPDGRVLMLYEARGYAFPRPARQDNRVVNWPVLARRGTADCLSATGITHVLVNVGARLWYESRGLGDDRLAAAAFAEFEDRCLAPVARSPGFRLYRVTAPGGDPAETD